MSASVQEPNASEQPASTEPCAGISALIARVLGQLSVSAWLPAAFFTVSLTLLVQFRLQGSMKLPDAIRALTEDQLTVLLLALPVLVCATLITQAFSFEAIRFLEGYWRRPVVGAAFRYLMIRAQLARKQRLHKRRIAASHHAFLRARARWLETYSPDIVNLLEREAIEVDDADGDEELRSRLSKEDQRKLGFLSWWTRSDPWLVAKVEHLWAAEREYPRDSRILPTRLGNLIRATEDRLKNAGEDLEGFALRRRALVPARVQQQHDQFRTRLDMYSILTLVSITLVIATPLLLLGEVMRSSGFWVVGLAMAFVLVAVASYHAAIASARGYLTALVQLDRAREQMRPTSLPPAP